MCERALSIIGVPLDLGAGRRGVDMGPSAFRVADVDQRLRDLGCDVEDLGDVPVCIPETRDPGDARLKYLGEIRQTCEVLRDKVEQVLARDRTPVVLGGDHSIAMGTIAGVSRHYRARGERIGLLWFDAHGDANTPETTPSGNVHGMPMAVALGLGHPDLLALGGAPPMVDGARAAIVGLRDVDRAERANVQATGIGAFTMRNIDERGMRTVMEQVIARALTGTAGIHVSFDVDAIDPDEAPGVGTAARGGLSYREAHLAMEMLADTGKVLSVELVEVNPVLDHRNQTAALGVELLTSLLGKNIL
jgi:arginase